MRFPLLLPLACALALFCARPALAQSATLTGRPWPPTDAPPALPTVRAVQAGAPSAADADPAQVAAATGDWMHDWTRIVFQSQRDGNWELYSARGDGTEAVRLTHTPGAEARPRVSPDGRRIAYDLDADEDGTREIWLMNADGGNVYALVASPGSDYAPAWSPDGTRLAFVTTRNGNADVYEVELGTGALRVIAAAPLADFDPAYNPQSDELYWVRQVDERRGTIQALTPTSGGPVEWSLTPELRYLQRIAVSYYGDKIAYGADLNGDGLLDIEQRPVGESDEPYEKMYGYTSFGGPPFWEPYINAYAPFMGGVHAGLQFTLVQWAVTRPGQLEAVGMDVRWVRFMDDHPTDAWRVVASGFDAFSDWTNVDHTPPTAFVYVPSPVIAATLLERGEEQWPEVVASDGDGIGNGIGGDKPYALCEQVWHVGGQVSRWQNSYCIGFPVDVERLCAETVMHARVRDAAGHWSAWAEASYVEVAARSAGRLTDVRGVGLPGIVVTGTQAYPGGPPSVTAEAGRLAGITCSRFATLGFGVLPAFEPLSLFTDESADTGPVALLPRRGVIWREPFDYQDYPFQYAWTVGPWVAAEWSGRDAAWDAQRGSSQLVLGVFEYAAQSEAVHLWARSRPRPPLAPPADRHAPTLAFDLAVDYRFDQVTPGVPFTVSVETSAWPTVTAVYTEALRDRGWQHRWAPFDLPVGDAITVTVEAWVPAGDHVPAIYVDNLAIASWWSPHVTGLDAAPLGAGLVMTLTGENFLPPLAVKVGDAPGVVEMVDAGTLRVTFPALPRLGMHTLAVTNRAGTAEAVTTWAAEALALGERLWLPRVAGPR